MDVDAGAGKLWTRGVDTGRHRSALWERGRPAGPIATAYTLRSKLYADPEALPCPGVGPGDGRAGRRARGEGWTRVARALAGLPGPLVRREKAGAKG